MTIAVKTYAVLRPALKKLPRPVRSFFTRLRVASQRAFFALKHGFSTPPTGTDLVGYEAFYDLIDGRGLLRLPGDLVEIGAFCGGGTYKLAKFLKRRGSPKTVYAVDVFDCSLDRTLNESGAEMAAVYSGILKGASQRDVFESVTTGLDNVVVIAGDSKKITLPTEIVCFAFIDGNHNPCYVQNDFHLVWQKLTEGGVVAFHDYGGDLPQVTRTIDRLCDEHRGEIRSLEVDPTRHIIYVTKRRR